MGNFFVCGWVSWAEGQVIALVISFSFGLKRPSMF